MVCNVDMAVSINIAWRTTTLHWSMIRYGDIFITRTMSQLVVALHYEGENDIPINISAISEHF